MTLSPEEQLQELYHNLDHHINGNLYIAWYGQMRAKEMSHAEALEATIEKWGLRRQTWFTNRGEFRLTGRLIDPSTFTHAQRVDPKTGEAIGAPIELKKEHGPT